MTCQELHCYLENPLRVEIYMYRESLPAAVLEHLEACGDCAHLFEEQKALGISLNMVRDTAPNVPAELDAKVIANYRRHRAEPESHRHGPRVSSIWLRWGVAAAVVVAVVATATFLSRKYVPVTEKKVAPVEAQIPATTQRLAPAVSAKKLPVESLKQEGSQPQVRKASAEITGGPLPPGFASLMYCDELTCSGAMEVIRVELPPPGQMRGPAASPIMAEVLVGSDGIARGIRIVQ